MHCTVQAHSGHMKQHTCSQDIGTSASASQGALQLLQEYPQEYPQERQLTDFSVLLGNTCLLACYSTTSGRHLHFHLHLTNHQSSLLSCRGGLLG